MAAVPEVAPERLVRQPAREDLAESLETFQLAGRRGKCGVGFQSRMLRRLDLPDLMLDQRKPFGFAPNLREQRYAQRPAIAGARDSESIWPIPRPDFDGRHPSGRQQALDAVAVRRALAHQALAFARMPTGVLDRRSRHPYHPRHLCFAALKTEQHTQQPQRVDSIGLHSSPTPRRLEARRVRHSIVDILVSQPPM